MTDEVKSITELTTEERRREIARQDYESRFSKTGAWYARKYELSDTTIFHDRRSDEYHDELEKHKDKRIMRLKVKSWAFAENVLDEGLKSTEEMPDFEDVGTGHNKITAAYQELRWREQNFRDKDRAAKLIQWFLEKTGEFNGKKEDADSLEQIRDIVNKEE